MIAIGLLWIWMGQLGGLVQDSWAVAEPWNTEMGRRHYEAWGLNPTDPEHFARFGIAMAMAENWERSAEFLSYALKLNSENAMVHGALGNVLVKLGRPSDAISHLREAIRLGLDDPFVHRTLARAQQRQELEKAVLQLEEAVRTNPEDARARMNLGFALGKAGRPAEAAEQFQAALQIQPSNADTSFHLGVMSGQAGHHERAIAAYRNALHLRPDWPLATRELAWLLATGPDESPAASAEAVKLAESVCSRAGYRDPVNLDTLAAAYASDGQFEAAVRTVTKAIELAREANNRTFAEKSLKRLELYQAGRPYRLPEH